MPRRVHCIMQDANDPDNPFVRGTGDAKQDEMPRASAVSCNVQRPIPCADFLTLSGADNIRAGLQGVQCIPEKLAVSGCLDRAELSHGPAHDVAKISLGRAGKLYLPSRGNHTDGSSISWSIRESR